MATFTQSSSIDCTKPQECLGSQKPSYNELSAIEMKRVFGLSAIIAMTFLGVSSGYSENIEWDYLPRCGGAYDLCGYVDRDTETELISAQFERAFMFSQGLAAVRIKGQYGFINLSGEVVIEPKFDLAGEFYEGLAEVLVGDVVGVIDKSGEFVVEPQFARAIPFTKDTLIVAKGNWRNAYFSGREELDGLNGFPIGLRENGAGLYHVSKGWVTDPVYNFQLFDEPNRGLVWATSEDLYHGPFGLLRFDGSWQVEPTYTYVQSLSEGLAVVRGKSETQKFQHNGRSIDPSGAVDRDGNLVIPLEFSFLSYWNAGFGIAQKGELYGLVLPDGSLLGGMYFDEVERPENERPPRVRDGKSWYSIRFDGTLIVEQNEGNIIASCPSGLTIREKTGLAAFSHPKLEAPIEPLFDRKHRYSRVDCDNPISVSRNGQWGFVTQAGLLITNPLSFDNTTVFIDGFAGVSVDGLWGIINEDGAFVVEPKFDRLFATKGRYQGIKDDQEFWFDAQGITTSAPAPEPEDLALYLECQGGSRLFAESDLWGMVGKDGAVIIAPKYRALYCFSQGVAWAATMGGTAWCPVGHDGQIRSKPDCRQSYYPYIQTHHYPEKFSEDPYENSVLWVRAFLDYGRGRRETVPVWISDGVQGNISSSIIRQ